MMDFIKEAFIFIVMISTSLTMIAVCVFLWMQLIEAWKGNCK